jgi:hypothetical protein
MKNIATVILIVTYNLSLSQVSSPYYSKPFFKGFFTAKGYSKELSIFRAKEFVINDILGLSDNFGRFELEALAASGSGELTSLIYNCPDKKESGLILGFYNDYWNDNGVIYQGYKFKNFPRDRALELFNKIDSVGDANSKYLTEDPNSANVFFTYEEIIFLLYRGWGPGSPIRIFWNGFDAEWDATAYSKTESRFKDKIEKK